MSTNKASEIRHRLPFSLFVVLFFLIWGCSNTDSPETEISDTAENISVPSSTVAKNPGTISGSEDAGIMNEEILNEFDNISENNLTCASSELNLDTMSLANGEPLMQSHTDIIEGEIYFYEERDFDSWRVITTGAKFLTVHSVKNLDSEYDYSWYGIPSQNYFVELVDENGSILERIPTIVSIKHGTIISEYNTNVLDFVSIAVNPPKYKSIFLLEISSDGYERNIIMTTKSNNSPQASVIEPKADQVIVGDTIEFVWTPSDLDQNYLTYMLWYSTDGGLTYTNLPGEEWIYTTLKSGIFTAVYELRESDIQKLAGSKAKLAVSISDGAQSTFAESPTFCVPQN